MKVRTDRGELFHDNGQGVRSASTLVKDNSAIEENLLTAAMHGSMPGLALICTDDGCCLYQSPLALSVMGECAKRKLSDLPLADFIHQDDLPLAGEVISQVKTKGTMQVNLRVINHNKAWDWWDIIASVFDVNGDPHIAIYAWNVDRYVSRHADLIERLDSSNEMLTKREVAITEVKKLLDDVGKVSQLVVASLGQDELIPVVRSLRDQIASTLSFRDYNPSRLSEALEQTLSQINLFLGEHESAGREIVFPGLTVREREVAHLVAQNHTSKEIARALGIAPQSVGVHRKSIRKKLGISGKDLNMSEALQFIINSAP